MKLLQPSVFLLLIILIGSCQGPGRNDKLPPLEPVVKPVTFLNADGNEIKEIAGNSLIHIRSEEFRELAEFGDIIQEGKIIIDSLEIEVKNFKGDLLTFELPFLGRHIPGELHIYFRFKRWYWNFCNPCILYLPTVEGRIYAGRDEGTFNMPAEMALNGGDLYVIDQRDEHDVIMKVTPDRSVSIFAGSGDEFGRLTGIDIDESRGLIYVADEGNQQVKSVNLSSGAISVVSGNGTTGNTTGNASASSFHFGDQDVSDFASNEIGQGLTLDEIGNIYVAELLSGSDVNIELRKITPAGISSVVPGSEHITADGTDILVPAGLTYDGEFLYFAGGETGYFSGVVKLEDRSYEMFAGQFSSETLNDGTGSVAEFSYSKDIDYYGDYLYVADGTNGALRRVSLDGEVITLAGVGHINTPTHCGCERIPPTEGSYLYPLGFSSADPDAFEDLAENIRMDQAGGVVARNNNAIFVSDFGYKIIWQILIR